MESERENRDESEASIDEILNAIGFGKVHLWILLTCGFYTMGTTTETMGIAIIGPLLSCDFDVTPTELSVLNGAVFFGMVLSAFFWSFFCDIYGRRKILLFSVLTSTPISIVSMLMPEYFSFLILRVILGGFIAGPSFVALTYLSEFCMQKYIAIMGDLLALFTGFGSLYFIGLASSITHLKIDFVIYENYKFDNWRLLGFMYTLPSICGMLLLVKLPETPKFLILKYRATDCQAVLEWLCKTNTGKTLAMVTTYKVKANTPSLILLRERMMYVKMWMGLRSLFSWHYMKRLLPVCSLQFFIFLIANGMGLWFTEFRNSAHEHCRSMKDICCAGPEEFSSCHKKGLTFTDSLLMAAVFILVCLLIAVSLHFTSRRISFSTSLAIASICGYALPFVRQEIVTVVTIVLFLTINAVITNLLRSAVIEYMPTVMREGFEFIMLQFAANSVHFTPLLAYQVHNENAPECLTLTHYTETKDKGIVLMRGEYDSKVLTGQEAQCLANELQMFYCRPDERKLKLLETFAKKPDEFKHMDLIKEVENIQIV